MEDRKWIRTREVEKMEKTKRTGDRRKTRKRLVDKRQKKKRMDRREGVFSGYSGFLPSFVG